MQLTPMTRSRFLRFLPAVALLTAASSHATPQNAPCGGPGPLSGTALFVPGIYVPLSDFQPKAGFASVTLTVDPRVLEWIDDETPGEPNTPGEFLHLRVALRSAFGSITYFAPTDADWTAGTVDFTHNLAGDCVVVSDLLRHNPTIVTHWKATLNSGRGRQTIGAKDGLFLWDYVYDPGQPPINRHKLVGPTEGPNGPIENPGNDWGDPPGTPSTAPYSYGSDRIALFSDGSGMHETAAAPAYERYIGESYSTNAYSKLAAIWLSDRTRERTGIPVAHRNHPDALAPCGQTYSSAEPGHAVLDGLPVFQVVHGHLVEPDDLPTLGNEHSLATFILPPSWTSEAAPATYPVLFNGFYDLNDNTFQGEGPRFLETLAEVYCEDGIPAVGLLWNGGGARACQTYQRSAYDNAAQLFDDAACLLRANKHKMVFTGGSRGGTTALAIAANPYRDSDPGDPDKYDYRATFVNSRAPMVLVGTTVKTYMNPTHARPVQAIDDYTGYKDSWKAVWVEPSPGSEVNGKTMVLRNLLGVEDPAYVDEHLSLDSVLFREGLKEDEGMEETDETGVEGVVLRIGTHDAEGSASLLAQYVNHLREDAIPVFCDVYYRFGHFIPYTDPDDAQLIRMAVNDDPLGSLGLEEIRYHATPLDPIVYNDHPVLISPSPSHVPLAVDMPLEVGTSFQFDPLPLPGGVLPNPATHTWDLIGQPGWHVKIYLKSSPFEPFNENDGELYSCTTLLPEPASSVVFGIGRVEVESLPPGNWFYRARYGPSPDDQPIMLDVGDDPAPLTFFTWNPYTPTAPFIDVDNGEHTGIQDSERTGGLSEDQRFLTPP